MRKEYELTDEEFSIIHDIATDNTPVIKVGVWLGMDKQERANDFWKELGAKYGFVWDSAQGVQGKGPKFFTAESTLN